MTAGPESYSAASRIASRIVARRSSIGVSRPARSICQKVQPLQAGNPLHQRADLTDRTDGRACGERANHAVNFVRQTLECNLG